MAADIKALGTDDEDLGGLVVIAELYEAHVKKGGYVLPCVGTYCTHSPDLESVFCLAFNSRTEV